MAEQATIKYVGLPVEDVRQGMNIPAIFEPTGSYVDSNVYVNGHPDDYGKREIGECIGAYLAAHFPWITDHLVKKPVPQALQAAP